MQSRRWWTTVAVALVCSMGVSAKAALIVDTKTPGARLPSVVAPKIKELAGAANAAEARRIVQELVDVARDKGNQGDVLWMDAYMQAVGHEVEAQILAPGVKASRDVEVNGIIAVVQIQMEMLPKVPGNAAVISVDAQLRAALKNGNPAVRYWAAKGLGAMIGFMTPPAPGLGATIAALDAALKVETSAPAQGQMIRALGAGGALTPLVQTLTKIATGLQGKAPDASALGVADSALAGVADAVTAAKRSGKLADKDEAAILSGAANVISFVAQYQFNERLDANLAGSVSEVIRDGVNLLNVTAGSKAKFNAPSARTDAASLLLAVDDITGSTSPGQLQKAFPAVPVPPRVK